MPSRDMYGGELLPPGAIAAEIVFSRPDGITISGGEPFLQAAELADMLRKVADLSGEKPGVIIYTGYTLEELETLPGAQELLALTDILIDGPYIRELDDGKSLRGSSNQRVHFLSDRYDTPEVRAMYGTDTRTYQIIRHGFGICRVGVVNDNDINTMEVY